MRRWILAMLALVTVASVAPVHADGSDSLSQSFRQTLPGGGVVSEGIGLSTRTGGSTTGSIQIGGVPAGAQVQRAFLYWAILAGDDPSVSFAGEQVTGTLIGRSPQTCWFDFRDPNPAYDNRAYRGDVTALVGGNGSYAVAGVGDVGGIADGQGASLVVVYSRPDAADTTTVVINDGALTGGAPGPNASSITHSFATQGLAQNALGARLHLGVGDTSVFPEGTVSLAGSEVVPAGSLTGSDGALWDDLTVDVAPGLLAGNSTPNRIDVGDDCMVWVYAALEVRAPGSSVVIAAPGPNAIVPRAVSFAGSAGPTVASIRLTEGAATLATIPVGSGSWSTTTTLPEGWHTVRAQGFDQNNQALPGDAVVTFRVDSRAPAAVMTEPFLVSADTGSRATIEGTATDDLGVDRVRLHWRDVIGGGEGDVIADCSGCGTPSVTWRADLQLDFGAYEVTAFAHDLAGNTGRAPRPVFVVRTG